MRKRMKKLQALLLSGLCCLLLFSGCGTEENPLSSNPDAVEDMQSASESPEASTSQGDADNSTSSNAADAQTGQEDAAGSSNAGAGSLGEFSVEDINGEAYTQEMFADYDLTLVNIFTTWCGPCIGEIPELQELRDEMAGKKVNVVGFVLDSIDESGSPIQETVDIAKVLAERTGVSYPFLIPDAGCLNGRLTGINAVPETFFVDKEGNIVGETYTGSRSKEEWKEIVEAELKGVVQ